MQVQQRASEIGKALDLLQLLNEGGEVTNMMGERFDWGQFRERLQLDTAAVMGHSFGGSTIVHTLFTDKRFKYAVCVMQPSKLYIKCQNFEPQQQFFLCAIYRCGIALDCWMHPVDERTLDQGIQQPLVFINSHFDFQVPDSIRKMVKLTKPTNRQGQL